MQRRRRAARNPPVGRFDFRAFDRLGCAARVRYADARLPLVGQGASRRVYRLGPARVLKLAFDPVEDDPARACDPSQNAAEARRWRDAAVRGGVAALHGVGPGAAYVVAEYAAPLDLAGFERATGVDTWDLPAFFGEVHDARVAPRRALARLAREDPAFAPVAARIAATPALMAAGHLVHRHRLPPDDLQHPDQYGVTTDGRLVLVDYGGVE